MIGSKIGHYLVKEKIGEGGMSSLTKKYEKLIPQKRSEGGRQIF